mmetsp:Transcript_118765/g.165486  ORF Transcript_118765/g.165486 Transcript_118765/m.165486 type:complete len:149 (-) Transcript_118765:18-464(-)
MSIEVDADETAMVPWAALGRAAKRRADPAGAERGRRHRPSPSAGCAQWISEMAHAPAAAAPDRRQPHRATAPMPPRSTFVSATLSRARCCGNASPLLQVGSSPEQLGGLRCLALPHTTNANSDEFHPGLKVRHQVLLGVSIRHPACPR